MGEAGSVFSETRMQEILRQHGPHRGVLKGQEAQQAVLCTQTRSFAVKHVETSNTLLLISPDVEVGMPEAQLQHNSIQCSCGIS